MVGNAKDLVFSWALLVLRASPSAQVLKGSTAGVPASLPAWTLHLEGGLGRWTHCDLRCLVSACPSLSAPDGRSEPRQGAEGGACRRGLLQATEGLGSWLQNQDHAARKAGLGSLCWLAHWPSLSSSAVGGRSRQTAAALIGNTSQQF